MYLTEKDIRDYIKDRSWEDNDLSLDLSYSSEEIETAMRSVAREYNSIVPMMCGGLVTPDCLPGATNMFLDGIVAALMRTSLINLSRNDISYNAGNMSADVEGNQIKHFRQLEREFQERFYRAATDYKRTLNIRNAFGQVG